MPNHKITTPKTNRKTYAYSSIHTQRTCEGLLKDRTIADKTTESFLIESAILDTYAPKNRNARAWVEMMYDGEGLAKAYSRFYAFCASGTTWNAAQDNGFPLVNEFCLMLSSGSYRFDGKEADLSHLLNQIDSIREMIGPNDMYRDYNLSGHFIEQLRAGPDDVYASDISSLILRNWNTVGHHTRTYRALMDLAKIAAADIIDTPYNRITFVDLLRKISEEW